jgi:hypothetical protein
VKRTPSDPAGTNVNVLREPFSLGRKAVVCA